MLGSALSPRTYNDARQEVGAQWISACGIKKVRTLHLKNLGDVKALADSDYDNTNLKIKRVAESGNKTAI